MSAQRPKAALLVAAHARHGPSRGCALRQGREALAFARHKQSSELCVSGLSLEQVHLGALLGHDQETLGL
jgi:hypothetical protein